MRFDISAPVQLALTLGVVLAAHGAVARPVGSIKNAQFRAAGCPGLREAIAGSWRHVRGGGFDEEMQFDPEPADAPAFRSWLHMRPANMGTWRVAACRLIIESRNDKLRAEYDVLNIGTRTIQVRYNDDPEPGTYRRIRE